MRRLLLATALLAVAVPLSSGAGACGLSKVQLDPTRIGEPEYRPQVQEPYHC